MLWYCATLTHDIGYTLEEIGEMNVEKLRSRKIVINLMEVETIDETQMLCFRSNQWNEFR